VFVDVTVHAQPGDIANNYYVARAGWVRGGGGVPRRDEGLARHARA